jgi:very-short-patch-repair endonuclease
MPLSWNEIKNRALEFAKEWKDEASEDAEAKSFWDGFFNIFGVSRRRVASFERPVKKADGRDGYIDLLWKGVLLVEHKSRGKDLDRAFTQALDYFPGLKERDLPRYVLVSDFARFRLYDLDTDEQHEFPLDELYKHVKRFSFIAGYQTRSFGSEDPVNIKAAELLGRLHDTLEDTGYTGHQLEVFLVRVLFCLFAEDTAIFERRQFQDYIEQRTAEDGSDLGMHLALLFQVLDQPQEKRLKSLDEQLAAFPYVNGRLFAEPLPIASFTRKMREALLDCCALDWSRISPAIFGSLFQSVMDKSERRNLGAHYTTETNILKAIRPLFLDELERELAACKGTRALSAFHEKLANIRVLDPACGCGNFLVIAYRELRRLELETLQRLHQHDQLALDAAALVRVDVDQFYGIEIEEFPAQIAQVALWLTDHQMNLRVSEVFGQYFARLPLKKAPNIVHGNALRLDWRDVIAPDRLSYIVGNPPFIGHQWRTAEQMEDMARVWGTEGRFGRLDYVTAWYRKAVEYMTFAHGLSASGAPLFLPSPASGRGAGGEGNKEIQTSPRPPTPIPADKLAFARKLRQEQTDAEQLIWGLVRNRRLKNAKFRRQHPLGPYILDFYCPEHKLAIELDGGQHGERQAYDHQRDQWLAGQGVRVLRFWNDQVLTQTEAVLEVVWHALPDDSTLALTPSPSPACGRGAQRGAAACGSGELGRESSPARGGAIPIRAAFVSTNSITQGEQVGILWPDLLARGVKIHFAHRTFQWTSEARGKAAVHCVIIGFGLQDVAEKWLYDYATPKSEPHALKVDNITPYLTGGPTVILPSRTSPPPGLPQLIKGSQPTDGGHLILTAQERQELLEREPAAEKWLRPYIGGEELINGGQRWYLWLKGITPDELRAMPLVLERVERVREARLKSPTKSVREFAAYPTLFTQDRQPDQPYLALPEVSSEHRRFIPMAFLPPTVVASNKLQIMVGASLFHFGVLNSTMHMAWVRTVSGRLESRYSYAPAVYNNFPWPECALTLVPSHKEQKLRAAIEAAAQGVLEARALYLPSPASGRGGEGNQTTTLADLYDPLTMPPELVKAHQALDRAVDAAYGVKGFASEAERVAFLFARYQQLTAPLDHAEAKPLRRRKPKKEEAIP